MNLVKEINDSIDLSDNQPVRDNTNDDNRHINREIDIFDTIKEETHDLFVEFENTGNIKQLISDLSAKRRDKFNMPNIEEDIVS